jgi:hypothetical protein
MVAFGIGYHEIDLAQIDIDPKHGLVGSLRADGQNAEERNHGKMSEPSETDHNRFLPQLKVEGYHVNSAAYSSQSGRGSGMFRTLLRTPHLGACAVVLPGDPVNGHGYGPGRIPGPGASQLPSIALLKAS